MKQAASGSKPVRHGLRSMTGYGRAEAVEGAFVAVAEISSVNRRQLDIRIHLPRCLALREVVFNDLVQTRLSRGHVTASVHLTSSDAMAGVNGLSRSQAHAAIEALRATAATLGLTDDLCASHLLQLTAVQRDAREPLTDAAAESAAVAAFTAALDALCDMRVVEGTRLGRDLTQRLESLRRRTERITTRAPEVAVAYRDLLQRRLAEAGHDAALEDEAFRRELLLFATRSDITEEITRLHSHFEQAADFLRSKQAVGRALDFLVQEISREINTLGSKASDARISREVVEFKTELDRFREQVQNVE